MKDDDFKLLGGICYMTDKQVSKMSILREYILFIEYLPFNIYPGVTTDTSITYVTILAQCGMIMISNIHNH